MARTKGSNVKRVPGPKSQSPRLPHGQKNAPTVSRQQLYRQGARARMEIHKWRYREPEKLLILRLTFPRLVLEVSQDYTAAPRFQQKAIVAVQYAVKSHLVKVYEDANLLAKHAKRITVYPNDLKLVRRIRIEIE